MRHAVLIAHAGSIAVRKSSCLYFSDRGALNDDRRRAVKIPISGACPKQRSPALEACDRRNVSMRWLSDMDKLIDIHVLQYLHDAGRPPNLNRFGERILP